MAYDQIPASLQPDYSKDVYTLFWDTIHSCKMLLDLYLLLFEAFKMRFKTARDGISTSRHPVDDMEAQKAQGLLCPCVQFHNHGTVMRITEHSTTSTSENKLKVLEIERNLDPGAAPGEKIAGCAIGDIEAGDFVYRITHVGIKIVCRPRRGADTSTCVGVAFTRQETEQFADSDDKILEKLERNHEMLRQIMSRGFREIPAHLVSGAVQYDIVLDREAILYFMSIDSRVMHRRWPEDGDKVIPYCDPGLQDAHRALTVQRVQCEEDRSGSSTAFP